MSTDPVAARYAQALCEHLAPDERLPAAGELETLAQIIQQHATLSQFLRNPDVEVEDKVGVIGRLLGGTWAPHVRAFASVVLSMGRAEHLIGMSEAFRALVDRERRVVQATVRSARPLSESLKHRLQGWMEQREGATITVKEEVDPHLLGGLQIVLGHRVIDGSISTQLARLRQRLKSVRVH